MIINLKSKKAFTLLEMSIVILIIGILLVGTINFQLTIDKKSKQNITSDKIAEIEKAINEYILVNGKLPCPASINIDKNNSDYGKEMRDIDNTKECIGYDSDFVHDGLIYGSVPTKTLNLTDDYAVDGWNNTISYIISKKYGDNKIYLAGDAKTIKIQNTSSKDITDKAIYVLVSTGTNKNGAFRNGSQLSAPDDDFVDAQNAFSKNFSDTFKKDIQTDTFDDIVAFKDKDMIIMKENMQLVAPCSLEDLRKLGGGWEEYTTYDKCTDGLCPQGTLIPSKNSCEGTTVSKNPSNTGKLQGPMKECLKYGKWSDIMYPCVNSCDKSNIDEITTNELGTGELGSAININYLKRAKHGETITLECIGEKFGYIKLTCQSNGKWKWEGGDCYDKEHKNIVCQNSELSSNNKNFSFTDIDFAGTTKNKRKVYGKCKDGYGEQEEMEISATCQADTTWVYNGLCSIRTCQNSDLDDDMTFNTTTETTNYNETQTGTCNLNGQSIVATCQLDGWHYSSDCLANALCDINDLRVDTDINNEHILVSSTSVGVVGSKFRQKFFKNTSTFDSNVSGTVHDRRYFEDGAMFDATCYDGYTEVKTNEGPQITNNFRPHAYVCQNGEWKRAGTCVDNCVNAQLNYEHITFNVGNETTTKYNNIRVGAYENGYSGPIIVAVCGDNASWEYVVVCDVNDLRGEGENVAISDKSPGVPGSKFRQNYNSSHTKGTVYNNNRYFTNGAVMDATCYNDDAHGHYTEVSLNGQITISEFGGLHAYKCVNGEWKRGGNCSLNGCYNSDLDLSLNAVFTTTGTTQYNKTQIGTCNTEYTGSVTATCQEDGSWSYTGSCRSENVCDKNDLSLVANSHLSPSNEDSQPISGTLYANGALLDASCNSGYVESANNGDIEGTWKSHAYKCVNGQWKTMGSCAQVNCDSQQIIQEMENNHIILVCYSANLCQFSSCETGYNTQVGNYLSYSCSNGKWNKGGGIQCVTDNNFCDINTIYAKLETTMNLNRNVINGSMYDNSSYANGTMIDAYCNSSYQYDEVATGGEIDNEWDKLLAFKCVNREWKRMGSCVKKCENSTLSLANTYFVTAGTTSVNGTQTGTCNSGYSSNSGSDIIATCKADGTWSYSGSCIKVCNKNDINLNNANFTSSQPSQPVSGTYYSVGSIVDVSCNNTNYIELCEQAYPVGNNACTNANDKTYGHYYICQSDGTWTSRGTCFTSGKQIYDSDNRIYTFQVPEYVRKIKFILYGGAGGAGNNSSEYIGEGGVIEGYLTVEPGNTLYVAVGGNGSGTSGGYNGGGDAAPSGNKGCGKNKGYGYGGGGATHLAKASGLLKNLSPSKIIAVAAGGGGASENNTNKGGYGGGTNYAGGDGGGKWGGKGGTTSNGGAGGEDGGNIQMGSFGQGADVTRYSDDNGKYCGGAGGGGYYGGGAGEWAQLKSGSGGGGGGGSNYCNSTLTDCSRTTSSRGNSTQGKAEIHWGPFISPWW